MTGTIRQRCPHHDRTWQTRSISLSCSHMCKSQSSMQSRSQVDSNKVSSSSSSEKTELERTNNVRTDGTVSNIFERGSLSSRRRRCRRSRSCSLLQQQQPSLPPPASQQQQQQQQLEERALPSSLSTSLYVRYMPSWDVQRNFTTVGWAAAAAARRAGVDGGGRGKRYI